MPKKVYIEENNLMKIKRFMTGEDTSHKSFIVDNKPSYEKDEYTIGGEGGNNDFFHINESRHADLDYINSLSYTVETDEDGNEYYDGEVYDMDGHHLDFFYGDKDDIEYYFQDNLNIAEKIFNKDAMKRGNFYWIEDIQYELVNEMNVDINNVEDVNKAAKKISKPGGESLFILTDGSIIGFYDHAEIQSVCDGMTISKFLELGNIRCGIGINGDICSIELIKQPTWEQRHALEEIIGDERRYVYLDFSKPNSNNNMYPENIFNTVYSWPNPKRIVNDITNYFVEGIKPVNENKEEDNNISNESVFEKWFGNSVLKDDNGMPIKMYHGTDKQFDSFDKNLIGATGSYEGYGFNFTPSETRATNYNSANVIEAYLKVENPMTTKSNNITYKQLINIISELDRNKPFTDTIVASYEPPRYKEKWDENYYRRALPLAAKTIYDYNKENEYGDAGIYAEICLCGQSDKIKTIDAFEKLGYDSAIFYNNLGEINTVVVFEPNQIKLTTNKTFNNNSDIMRESINKNANFDIISLAKERYGTTNNINQAGYILPDGSLLDFGRNGYREEDHRGIEGIYKQNNIQIWDDKYRYNYVVDFMNHGAIRCCVNGGILDMTKEPTKEQYFVIKTFVRKAVDVDMDFTDDKGDTLHSVSYSNAKPQQVVGDIYRYYNEGIKPQGNVQYEEKKIIVSENQLKTIKENLDLEVDSSEVDLSSFKKKHELAPNIWKPNGELNSRVRLKLLDIADDFWEFTNINWVKRKGIHLTGSICNFNWSKFSDIDLHIVVDFSDVDERKDFVQEYFNGKKNEWNNEHSKLKIYGYPVELYVEDIDAETMSGGLYDLEDNSWLKKPSVDDIKSIGIDKYEIKSKSAKLMTLIDDLKDEFNSTDDNAKLREIGNKAHRLLNRIKRMRKFGLSRGGESDPLNIAFKVLRRSGYMDSLWELSSELYDKLNSIGVDESKILEIAERFIRRSLNEEVVADGSSSHNPFKERWKHEREALKNYLVNYGEIMTSKENGKQYKVLYDSSLSSKLGINYCICIQWNQLTMEPGEIIYVRAFDKFTRRLFKPEFDTRGFDNIAGNADDVQIY